MDQVETVLRVMKDAVKPLRAGEMAELSGLDRREVDKTTKELKKQASIFSPKNCFWQASG